MMLRTRRVSWLILLQQPYLPLVHWREKRAWASGSGVLANTFLLVF